MINLCAEILKPVEEFREPDRVVRRGRDFLPNSEHPAAPRSLPRGAAKETGHVGPAAEDR